MSNYDIILCGPVSGIANYKMRFAVALVNVRRKQIQAGTKRQSIWNPAVMPDGRSEEWYIWECLKAIKASPNATLVMLPGWKSSKCAKVEHALGVFLKRKVEEL